MVNTHVYNEVELLAKEIEGDVFIDEINRISYSTDASAYKEQPLAVVRPKSKEDLIRLIHFARKSKTTLIPRTAGTSLAGQVVGNGIILDLSRYFTNILEINPEEKWVRVEPGVILDELNMELAQYGLFFGPETSTSNRCMMGGMLGNNSCGAHSLLYGTTREHTISVKALLSDGSEAEFGALTDNEFKAKCDGNTLESLIYRSIEKILNNPDNQKEIREEYPHSSIVRRNTGYALDYLLNGKPFTPNGEPFNFCKLIAGSEGTLALVIEIKLNLVPLPPPVKGLVCVHLETLEDALKANLIALKYKPGAVELMDDTILSLTKQNIEQRKNRFFVKGDPAAILIIEFARDSKEEIEEIAQKLEKEMRETGFGYHFPLIFGSDIKKVWNLRKAGLGVLSNLPGDGKPVSVIEDTAVNVEYLPDYIKDFKQLLKKYNLESVYHAHISVGELHLRPILNLKSEKDVDLFRKVALETAQLVKKYKGSLSGEHGDGRLRGEFIPVIIGEKNYQLLKEVKAAWDPEHIFNAGKITDTPRMDTFLRYTPGQETREFDTIFDYSDTQGLMRLVEKCNGSGDCRKSEIIGGTMCPSYMATRDEDKTTRARANVLREYLTHSDKKNPFDHQEIYEVLDLCLSCKGCKSECPSNVDMAKLKAEFLFQYFKSHRIPLRTLAIAYISKLNAIGALVPKLFNYVVSNSFTSGILKKLLGFAQKRSIPRLYKYTLRRYIKNNLLKLNQNLGENTKSVNLFVDEFTNFNDTEIGIKAIKLLNALGYKINVIRHAESGRTYLSKGLLRQAKKMALKNIHLFSEIVTEDCPLIGIEPSAILAFRDEYPDLAGDLKEKALKIAKNALMFDEFFVGEVESGRISKDFFTKRERVLKLHGHCQQKSVASTTPTIQMLSIPENYSVSEIKSGCCGMAGSFGFEKEHYDLSVKVGELVLLPEVRKSDRNTIIVATGTSCRHQIEDETGRNAVHPVEVLYDALLDEYKE